VKFVTFATSGPVFLAGFLGAVVSVPSRIEVRSLRGCFSRLDRPAGNSHSSIDGAHAMNKRLPRFPLILFIFCSTLLAACNLKLGGDFNPEDQQPTHSAGLGAGQPENLPSSSNKTYPPNYGQPRIEYDHQFSLDAMQGGGGLKMEIHVTGDVPMNLEASGWGQRTCSGETLQWPYLKLHGENQVRVVGSGTFSTGDEGCSCTLAAVIEVKAQGMTHAMPASAGAGCESIFVSIQLDETWYKNSDWTCSCSDAEDNPIAEMAMERMPAVVPPDLAEKTIRFDYYCPGSFRQEQLADPTGTLKGHYIWTWRPGMDEVKGDRAVVTLTTEDLDIQLFPQGAPSCASSSEAVFGPPLPSIDSGVTEWFPQ
jgi:hypothetical protein